MQEADSRTSAFLIADRNALVRYGLGMVSPDGRGLRHFLRVGYLVEADSLDTLAARLVIDASGLTQTTERMIDFANTDVDREYAPGTAAYERNLGDPAFTPNQRGVPSSPPRSTQFVFMLPILVQAQDWSPAPAPEC